MRHRPVLTLAVAVLVQYAMLSFEKVDEPPGTDFWQAIWPYFDSVLTSYLVYFVIGGVLALHMAEVTEWVRPRRRRSGVPARHGRDTRGGRDTAPHPVVAPTHRTRAGADVRPAGQLPATRTDRSGPALVALQHGGHYVDIVPSPLESR